MESNIVKKKEQKLIESEEKYRLISENANDLFAVLNNKFEYEYINEKAYQKILGYSNEDILGKAHYDIINPEDYKISHNILRRGFKKGGSTGELKLRHKNGKYIWVETKASVFKNSDGLLKVITISRDITDRILSEKRLKESEEKYRLISEGSDDLILAYNEKMEIEYVNGETHERILGYSAHLFWKQDFLFSIIHQDDRKILGSAIREGYKGGPYKLHIRYKHEKGHYIWFEFRGKTYYDKNGSKKSLVVGRDITDIKVIQDQLQESEEKYRELFEEAPHAYFSIGPDKSIKRCNKAAERLLNYSKEELLHMTVFDLYADTKNGIEKAIGVFNRFLSGEEIYDEELLMKTKNGNHIWISMSSKPVLDAKGNTIESRSIVIDITERKQFEQELRIKESAIRSSINAIAITNLKGVLTYVNPSFLKFWGYSTDTEILGKNSRVFWQPKEKVNEIIAHIQKIGNWDGELSAQKKDGSIFYVQLSASMIYDMYSNPISVLASFIDITHRKKAEEEIAKALEEIKRSNAELEVFAYIASHDLHEPLRMVSGFAKLLQKRYKDILDKEAHDFIDFIVDGATRMQNLINDLLMFSRVGTRGKVFKPTDMNIILEVVLNILRESVSDSNAVITSEPLPVIIADETQMIQLFQNLIANAIKFKRSEPPKIKISGETKNNEWLFTVQDNGIGIDSKNFERIFIIFQRLHTKGEYPGTGIGLAVCKKIIQRHGGKLWVESKLEKGSTFFFSIPREQDLDKTK